MKKKIVAEFMKTIISEVFLMRLVRNFRKSSGKNELMMIMRVEVLSEEPSNCLKLKLHFKDDFSDSFFRFYFKRFFISSLRVTQYHHLVTSNI